MMAYCILLRKPSKKEVCALYGISDNGNFPCYQHPIICDNIFKVIEDQECAMLFDTKEKAEQFLEMVQKYKEGQDFLLENPENIKGKRARSYVDWVKEGYEFGPFNAKVVEVPETIEIKVNGPKIRDQIQEILIELYNK